MKHFKWVETTQNVNSNDLGAMRSVADNFISRRAGQSKRIDNLCTPLNIFLALWFLFVTIGATFLVFEEIVPYMS